MGQWYGVVVPAATPQAIVQRLNELIKILDMADFRRSFTDQGADIEGGTAAAFGTFMREEQVRWGAVIKQACIKAE